MKNPNNRKVTIKKVPLHVFLTLLNNLYADGADYVDLHADVDENRRQDSVRVSVPLDYMSEEAKADMNMEEPADPPPGITTEDDEEEEAQDQFPAPLTEQDILNLLKNV